MKRLFVALKIQPGSLFLNSFLALKTSLRHENIKWVEMHNIHVTLKFFGDMRETLIPEISKILKHEAEFRMPFNIKLNGLGIFGSSYSPRVIWVGIEPYVELSGLMHRLQRELEVAGFESDRQNLVPHLTLGRIKALKDKVLFNKVIASMKEIISLPILIDKMILFESILKQEGPEYLILEQFNFKKNSPEILNGYQGI